MDKSYVAVTESINRGILELRKAAPDALAGFSAMAHGAMAPGALSELPFHPPWLKVTQGIMYRRNQPLSKAALAFRAVARSAERQYFRHRPQ
jgi:hypothetical protein